MQIVIDMPEEVYNGIISRGNFISDFNLSGAIANGILLPEDATNGDMIKALFPNGSQVKGASIYVMNDNKSNVFYDFDWWNAPYKADKEK